jgi:hypothetical protein
LWPGDSKAEIERNRNGEVGEGVAVPDEGMPTNDDVGRCFHTQIPLANLL